METLYFTHPSCPLHQHAASHIEQPDRVVVIDKLLRKRGLMNQMTECVAPRATHEQLCRAHTESHVERIFDLAPDEGCIRIDADTGMNPHSLEAALAAAGALVAATDRVLTGDAEAAFCNVRPPGHHAERHQAMGFCLFNNVAVGIHHALEHHGLERVAIVDFDVHHGNGTEQILLGERRVMMCSTYQWPLYPNQMGATEDGHMVNVPLPAGAGREALTEAVYEGWAPALRAFRPELLYISAGFDAHRNDPLASLAFETDDYAWLTAALIEIVGEAGCSRVISTLEGGYDLPALADSACAHVASLIEA